MEAQYIIASLFFGLLLTIPAFCLGLYMGRHEEKEIRAREEQCRNCSIAFENFKNSYEDDLRRIREKILTNLK